MVDLSVVIPAYNEEQALRKTIGDVGIALRNIKASSEIIVVDDGSTDATSRILKALTNIRVLKHQKNFGYGAALKTGIREARGKWILIVDSDGTYPADAIPKLWKENVHCDMAVGARTGQNVSVPFFRRPAKWFLNKIATYLTGTDIPDLNSGLRMFRKDIAERFYHLFPDGFSFTTTITVACLTNAYSVKFIPINYYKRKGKSTMRPHQFLAFLQLIVRLITYFKPLNFFLPISVFFFIIGFIKMAIDFYRLNHFGAGGVMVVLASIQILFIGLLADLIIRRTNV